MQRSVETTQSVSAAYYERRAVNRLGLCQERVICTALFRHFQRSKSMASIHSMLHLSKVNTGREMVGATLHGCLSSSNQLLVNLH